MGYTLVTASTATEMGTRERTTTYRAGNWSKATCVPNLFSDAPRRSMRRETISVERTLERTEKAVLEVQIVALKKANELLTSELADVSQERDNLRQDRDKWREMAHTTKQAVKTPVAPRRSSLWRLGR